MGSTGDRDLVAAAVAGDRRATEELLARHLAHVDYVCRQILWRPEHRSLVEDARQDALLHAARGLARFAGRAQFSTWVHRIAVNAALDVRARAGRNATDVSLDDEPGDAATSPPADDRSVERLAVQACLDKLPAAFRDVLVLGVVGGLPYDEVAAVLGISPGTVKSRASRAREAMRTCLRSAGVDAPSTVAVHRQ